MPRRKSKKIVSLVAYQSGDESEGGESDQTESDISDHSETESNTSKKSSDFVIQDVDEDNRAPVKRHRESNEQIDLIQEEEQEQQSDIVIDTKKSKKQEDITDLESMPNNGSPAIYLRNNNELLETDKEIVLSEDQDSNESEQALPSDRLTLGKGFPPGCQDIKLPSAPTTECSQTLQKKIITVVDRMERFNYSMNNDIQQKKMFKNPCIYEKLIAKCGIDEFGSSFPTHVEDLKSDGYIFYDELDNIQRAEWAKIEKMKKERTKIEMVSGTKKSK